MKRTRTSSGSTFRIIAGIVLVLAVLVLAVYLFAPGKPPPPPRSSVRYEAPSRAARPAEQVSDNLAESLPAPLMRRTEQKVSDRPAVETEPAATTEEPPLQEITLKVSGVILSASGRQPLADITVAAAVFPAGIVFRENFPDNPQNWKSREMYGEGTTDADGRVSITIPLVLSDRETGICAIAASGKGFGRVLTQKSFSVSDSAEVEVTFELAMEGAAAIEGTVTVEGTGEGIPEIVVSAQGPGGTVKTATDQNGTYRITDLASGEYSVAVEFRETEFRPGKELPFKKIKISREGETVRNVDFSLERAGIVWGYVLSPEGAGVSRANVMLCTSDSPFSQMLTAMASPESVLNAFTQDDGYYELRGVPLNREWRLYATSPSHSPQLADPFVLTANADAVRIDIYLFSGSMIRGIVVDSSGQRVPDADVICAPAYGRLFQANEAPIAFRDGQSDAQGTFTITEIPPGEYQLLAVKEGYRRALRGVPVYSDGYSEITGVRLELESAEQGDHQIFGVVLDDRGQGLDGAQVRLVAGGDQPFEKITTTGGGGRFQFDSLAPGYYMLTVTMDGFSPVTVRRVRLDQETRVAMRRSATVRGVVRVRSGELPATYTVRAYLISDDQGRSGIPAVMSDQASNEAVFSDPSGAFQMQLNAGLWRLEAVAEGYAPARVEITVQSGQILDGVELVLNESG
ncbi:MAG TPA: carboxypeptidase regulatory-like domain-containing protein, partial [Candidatus Hydrogenedentes bacterium]|nr:carboxypeptidase regulatory-like domain-containing protein [Candidatus Hydrogenedentota bacterium]